MDNRLSSMLLDGRLRPGQHVTVAVAGDALDFRIGDREPATSVPAQAGSEADQAADHPG